MKTKSKRGPYKRKGLKKIELTFLNINPTHSRRPGIKVATTCISIDADTAKAIGFKNDGYVVVAKKDKEIYLTIKPKGVIAGHHLRASKSGRLTAHIRTKLYKMTPGVYQPGQPVLADIPTEQGEFVETTAYPLVIE